MAFVAIKARMVAYEYKALVRKACSGKGIHCMALLTVLWKARAYMTRRPLIIVHVTGIAVVIHYPRYLARVLPVRMTLVAA